MDLIKKIKMLARRKRMYVTLDPADNSVTLSQSLFEHMRHAAKDADKAQIYVFRVPHKKSFGFVVNPDIEQPTQLCDVQYNAKYQCVGFETLCPSVGAMFHFFRLPPDQVQRLAVKVEKVGTGMSYYLITPPNA